MWITLNGITEICKLCFAEGTFFYFIGMAGTTFVHLQTFNMYNVGRRDSIVFTGFPPGTTNECLPNSFSILSILGRCLGKTFHRIRWKWFFPKEFQTAWRWQGMLVNETFTHSSFLTSKFVNSTQKTTCVMCV